MTASAIGGRMLVGWIVCTPLPGIANSIVSTIGSGSPPAHSPGMPPEGRLSDAAVIASRSVHAPSSTAVSPVELTVIVFAVAAVVASRIAVAIACVSCLFMKPPKGSKRGRSWPPFECRHRAAASPDGLRKDFGRISAGPAP
jgi:hypothetical protein